MKRFCLHCGANFNALRARRKYCTRRCADDARFASLTDRFWEKVEKTDGCWLWTAARVRKSSYGVFRVGNRNALAHRFSYELAHGAPGAGLYVCHSCDTPSCVNPAHLFIGTQADNIHDCVAKGRYRHATTQPARRKITLEIMAAVRSEREAHGYSHQKLGRMHSLSKRTIAKILHHTTCLD
jgi:hypothetical protein